MKISETPTDKIIVKAYTNSEWDNCEFAVITLKESFFEWLQKSAQLANFVALEDRNFYEISFLENKSITNFYILNEEEKPDLSFLEENDKGWAFVELSEEEENSFSEPENRIICRKIIFDKCRCFYIKAFGKYSEDEFFTEEIHFDTLFPKHIISQFLIPLHHEKQINNI